MSTSDIIERNDNGKITHVKSSDGGFECWHEYNEKGDEISYKTSDGYEEYNTYNKEGKLIHFKTSNGYECHYDYDEKGNLTHFKTSDGFGAWYEYNDKNQEIYKKDTQGFEEWNEYYESGHLAKIRDSDGYETLYDEESGDVVTPKTETKNRVETLQSNLESLTTSLRVMIETYMKDDGLKECDSQRMCLLNRLSDLEYTINGIQEEDLKGNE